MLSGRKAFLFVFSCYLLHSSVAVAAAQGIKGELDLEMILSGVAHHHSLVKSGEGVVTYKRVQTSDTTDGGHIIIREYYLTFNEHYTRMDISESLSRNTWFPKLTYINAGTKGEWQIQHEESVLRYTYSTRPSNRFASLDPRWVLTSYWPEGEVYEHLKQKDFRIKRRQRLGDIDCYVLEDMAGGKIWIAPDLGFRFIKYERQFALEPDLSRRGIKKGAPMVVRIRVFYQKNGNICFPKQTVAEAFIIDENGQEHLLSKNETETKDFRLNDKISEDKFTITIPEESQIWVSDLRRFLSKKEFSNLYGMVLLK